MKAQEARAQATEFEKNVREFEAQFGGEYNYCLISHKICIDYINRKKVNMLPHTNLLFDNHLKAQKNRVGVTFRRVVL